MRFTYTFPDGRKEDLGIRLQRFTIDHGYYTTAGLRAECRKWNEFQDEIEELTYQELDEAGDLIKALFEGLEDATYDDFAQGMYLGIKWMERGVD